MKPPRGVPDAAKDDVQLDLDAQAALVKRTRTMSDREMLEYLSDTMQKAAMSRPQRRNKVNA